MIAVGHFAAVAGPGDRRTVSVPLAHFNWLKRTHHPHTNKFSAESRHSRATITQIRSAGQTDSALTSECAFPKNAEL